MTLIEILSVSGETIFVNPEHIQAIVPIKGPGDTKHSKLWVASNPNDWGIEVPKDPTLLAREIASGYISVV